MSSTDSTVHNYLHKNKRTPGKHKHGYLGTWCCLPTFAFCVVATAATNTIRIAVNAKPATISLFRPVPKPISFPHLLAAGLAATGFVVRDEDILF